MGGGHHAPGGSPTPAPSQLAPGLSLPPADPTPDLPQDPAPRAPGPCSTRGHFLAPTGLTPPAQIETLGSVLGSEPQLGRQPQSPAPSPAVAVPCSGVCLQPGSALAPAPTWRCSRGHLGPVLVGGTIEGSGDVAQRTWALQAGPGPLQAGGLPGPPPPTLPPRLLSRHSQTLLGLVESRSPQAVLGPSRAQPGGRRPLGPSSHQGTASAPRAARLALGPDPASGQCGQPARSPLLRAQQGRHPGPPLVPQAPGPEHPSQRVPGLSAPMAEAAGQPPPGQQALLPPTACAGRGPGSAPAHPPHRAHPHVAGGVPGPPASDSRPTRNKASVLPAHLGGRWVVLPLGPKGTRLRPGSGLMGAESREWRLRERTAHLRVCVCVYTYANTG